MLEPGKIGEYDTFEVTYIPIMDGRYAVYLFLDFRPKKKSIPRDWYYYKMSLSPEGYIFDRIYEFTSTEANADASGYLIGISDMLPNGIIIPHDVDVIGVVPEILQDISKYRYNLRCTLEEYERIFPNGIADPDQPIRHRRRKKQVDYEDGE